MASWFENQSIRSRIVLLTLAILLPVGGILVWLVVNDLRHARDEAHTQVRVLANRAAADIEHLMQHSEAVLARLAARPRVRSLDPADCDPIVAEYIQLNPEYMALGVRDRHGRIVCAFLSNPVQQLSTDQFPWFEEALRSGRFSASDAFIAPRLRTWVTALTHPIRDDAGAVTGLLILPVDLLSLGPHLLGRVPADAVVTVFDRKQTVLLRSAVSELHTGQRPGLGDPDPVLDAREGFVTTKGHDGVPRLFSYLTVADIGWRVAASLPQAVVFAQYDKTLKQVVGIGLGVFMLAMAMAWRMSAAIVRPMADLGRTVARVAAGEHTLRATASGPPEVKAVAREFNQMLEARLVSEIRLHSIFDAASDAILTADESQIIVMANPAAVRMFGCELDQMLGAPLERWIPERYRAQHNRKLKAFGRTEVISRPMGRRPNLTGLRANGEEFPIEAAVSHVRVDGQPLYTVILRDVTERQRSEDALLASKAKLDAALASMHDAMFITDAEGRFIEFNDACVRFHRFERRDQCPKTSAEYHDVLALFMPDGQPAAPEQAAVTRALRGETATNVEYTLRRRNSGESWTGSYSFAPIRNPEGVIVGSVVTARDVSALKQAQADREASHAELQRLVAAQANVQENERKRIARELHDELQQTLAAIKMDANAIGSEIATDPTRIPPLVRRIEELASAAIASTRRIINDLRPKMLEELGLTASLEALASQFTQRTGTACEVKAVGLSADSTELPSETATCLYRVAQESLNNVAKHAHARSVSMQLSRLAGGGLRLRIRDDGRGLSAGDRHKADSFGILGMHERVRATGGTLRVQSRPGAGTTIDVEIPGSALRPTPAGSG